MLFELDPVFGTNGVVAHDDAAGGHGSDIGFALAIDAVGLSRACIPERMGLRSTCCLLGLLTLTACETDPPSPASPSNAPAPTAPAPTPELLPALAPEPAPLQGRDGFALTVDLEGELPRVTVRNDGTSTFQGHVRFRLVWTGASTGPSSNPWRAVTSDLDCSRPGASLPPRVSLGGAMPPQSVQTFEMPLGSAQFCNGTALDAMELPPGRYRVSATFESQGDAAAWTLWSQPFMLSMQP